MTVQDLLPLVIGNLRRMKGRVLLTALGVVIGTASLIVLISLGAGLQRLSTEFTSGSSLTEVHFTPHSRYKVVQGAELDRMASEAPPSRCGNVPDDQPVVDEDMREQFAALPGVSWVAVYEMLLGTPEIEVGKLRGYSGVWGVAPTLLTQLGLEVARGTLTLERGDAVIGAEFAASLYDPAERDGKTEERSAVTEAPSPRPDLLGKTLTLRLTTLGSEGELVERTVRVRVVGELAPKGWLYDTVLYLPERDVVELNNWMHGRRAGTRRDPARQGYTGVVVKAEDLQSVAAVEEALNELGFPVYTERKQLEEWTSFFTALQVFLGSIGAISLLVAAFGISNTMLMAIHERTQEIGLMKAIGASNRAVRLVFLTESAGIGLLGGLGGIVAGLTIALLLGLGGTVEIAGLPAASVHTPPWLPGFALLFAIGEGVLSGTYPAHRAAKLVPIVALKYE
ncbi:MAG: ABC transporter permease [Anaerolineae bacterium]